MELNGWSSPQMLLRYGASAAAPAPAVATTASWTCPEAQAVTRAGQLMQPAHAHRRQPSLSLNADLSLAAGANLLTWPMRVPRA